VIRSIRALRPIVSRLLGQIPYVPRALSLVWTASRVWTSWWLAFLFVQGLLPIATVYLTRSLVNQLTAAVGGGGGWEALKGPVLLALIMVGILVVQEVNRAAIRWIRTAQAELVRDHVNDLIHDRCVAADLAYYESPDYHDQLHRALADAQNRPVALLENLGALFQNGLMSAVLVPFGWWVPLALLISTLPALAIVIRFAIRQHDWRVRTTPDNRRTRYLTWILSSREVAPELRIFGIGSHFRAAFTIIRRRLRSELISISRSQAAAEVSAGLLALTATGATLAIMIVRTIRGGATLGDLAMFYQAFSQGQKLMRTLLDTVGQMYSNILFLENLFDFLETRPQIVDPETRVRLPAGPSGPTIRFNNVSFKYPAANQSTLESFSLTIPSNSLVALLGVNGAGKSTLFKLLCRLYDPADGAITLDGIDLRTIPLEDLRRRITILFQQPVHYSETVRQNIQIGDLRGDHSLAEVVRSARQAGADGIVDRMPQGYDTLLGTWFAGGIELSVGEWQRLALSRAFLRDADIILLDEPTSAMDSWAELDWIRRLRRLVRGKTAVIITHRLSTARHADIIHVMDCGQIIESGTHSELLDVNGKYASAWIGQTEGQV